MNLIQRGTTASRANRGKSVENSIAQGIGTVSYGGNRVSAGRQGEELVELRSTGQPRAAVPT
jgi:hypothetical protein